MRQRRSEPWDDTPEGMGRRAGESVACLALASVFLPELSLLRTRGLDGCSCQVRMALSICRRVESLMPRAEGRRHETLAEAGCKQEPPAPSETAAEHPRAQLAARQADRHGTGVHADQAGIT